MKRFFVLFSFLLVFFVTSCSQIVNPIKEKVFTAECYGRDKKIYIQWTEPENIDFTLLKVKYQTADNKEKTEEYKLDKDFDYYILTNLVNNNEYKINLTFYDKNNKTYKKTLKAVPSVFNANIDRLTAIYYEDKIQLSFGISNSEELNIKNIRVYNNEKSVKTDFFNKVLVYEESDYKVDPYKPYSNYYVCQILDSNYFVNGKLLELCIVNDDNIESNRYSFAVDFSNLPVVEINLGLTNNNLSIFSSKKKLDAKLTTYKDNFLLNNEKMTIKGRGNSSWLHAPKKSYTIKFDQKLGFLGMKNHKSFALIANYFDKTLLRNSFAYSLAKNVFTNMDWTCSCKSVNLFLDGVYQGIYTVVESNKIDKNRINIPNLEDCITLEEFYNYGYLLEVNDKQDEDFNFYSEQNVPFSLKEPEAGDLDKSIKDIFTLRIKEHINKVENALYSTDFNIETSTNYYANFIDVDSFIDWYLVEEFAKNIDSNFVSSCYMYFNPETQKLHMGPVWDFDLGFGNFEQEPDNKPEGLKTATNFSNSEKTFGNWIKRLLEDEKFVEKVFARWNEKSIEVSLLVQNIDTNYLDIFNDQNQNFTRWPTLGTPLWKNPLDAENRKTYKEELEYFKTWCNSRIAWMNTNWIN